MVDPLPTPLSGVYYFWSLLLLPSSLLLNLSAFFLTLRSAGSCYRDPLVPTLLSILGSNLLQGVLVQVFMLHQQSTGLFLFSHTLCQVIQVNQAVLQDIPFTTISLQLIATLRRIKKEQDVYTHFNICCGQFLVILIPWVVAIVTNTLTMHNHPVVDHSTGVCPVFYPSSLWQFIIRIIVVVGIPFILVLLVFLTTLPYLSTCVGPLTCESNPINHNTKQDLTLLSVLILADLMFQLPTKIGEIFLHYRHTTTTIHILHLIINITADIPLLINPLGVLLLRGLARRDGGKAGQWHPPPSPVHSPSEENLKMIVSMEGKDLEAALFKAKTTSL